MKSKYRQPHAIALLCSLAGASAQAADNLAKDTSGTNPTLLLRSLNLSNEYSKLQSGSYLNNLSLKYTEPFMDGKMSLKLNVPALQTDAGPGGSGLGDMSLKWTWVASVAKTEGWVVNSELYAPTGEDFFTGEQWVVAPGITYVRFLSPEVIVAPAYVHSLGFAGNERAVDVNAGTIDLYVVYRPQGQSWWLTADLTMSLNYENTAQTPMNFELQYGRKLGKVGGATVNGFLRPGIGIGDDRPYDWNLQIGLSLIGF
jgi:hypothetical protein